MKKILVLCTGNSCRSQIAHGYIQFFASNKAAVFSAGVETHGVNPKAIETMAQDNIDISHHTSNNISEYYRKHWDFIITVCDHAQERCPIFPYKGAIKLHKNFPDPSKLKGTAHEIDTEFSRVRKMIKRFCKKFVAENISV